MTTDRDDARARARDLDELGSRRRIMISSTRSSVRSLRALIVVARLAPPLLKLRTKWTCH